MAALEQLIFGYRTDSVHGREVLAISPGLARDCADEVVRLCEGWGAVPAEGLRRSALMSFPLVTRLASLPGDLYVVIRVAAGLRPVFHAVVLGRRDYEAFDLNPYVLAQEDPFLDSWQPDEDLPRRELRPGALAPVVSPPPNAGDVGFVDEAVRQLLANQRLLLPLERSSSDSDRFLALLITALPRVLRQDLRFASWSPSGTNRYSLAATFQDSALFTSWQPYLMTTVLGQLEPSCEEYVAHVRTCLQAGDLASLEQHGRQASVDISRAVVGGNRTRRPTLSAAVDEQAARRIDRRQSKTPGPAARSPISSRQEPGHRPGARTGRGTAAGIAARKDTPRPRPRPARRRRPAGKVRRVFAVLLSLAILGAGAYYFWTAGHWTRLPGLAAGQPSLQNDPRHGVVDVASLYAGILGGIARGDAAGSALADPAARDRGLNLLNQAGDLLATQGHRFLADADQTLDGVIQGRRTPAPAQPLHERGRALARELRRLALARVSLGESVDWQDLAELDGRALEVRLDSLLTSRQRRGALEPQLASVDDLLLGVSVRTRQVGGLATLEQLLSAERWDPRWNDRCADAVDHLGGVRQGRARQLRADAAVLLRLKRAEHATDLGARAYHPDHAPRGWATPAVLDVLPDLRRRATVAHPVAPGEGDGTAEAGAPDRLLRDTAAFYAALASLTAAPAPAAEHAATLDDLRANRAVQFDPGTYADHVGRLRFLLLERLVAADTPLDSLPPACFAGGDAQDHLDVLQVQHEDGGADRWQALAAHVDDPFLARWAEHEARRRRDAAADQARIFAAALSDLDHARDSLLRIAAAGGRCGEVWVDLAHRAASLRDAHAGGFPGDGELHAAWRRVAALADRLATPPPLRLAGVTVRLDQDRAEAPPDVVVELLAGRDAPRRSRPVELGPSAPAGSGWVGAAPLDWDLPLMAGEPLQIRVLDAADGALLGVLTAGGWLEDCEPADLGSLGSGDGVRVSLRPAGSYWDLDLPGLM